MFIFAVCCGTVGVLLRAEAVPGSHCGIGIHLGLNAQRIRALGGRMTSSGSCTAANAQSGLGKDSRLKESIILPKAMKFRFAAMKTMFPIFPQSYLLPSSPHLLFLPLLFFFLMVHFWSC